MAIYSKQFKEEMELVRKQLATLASAIHDYMQNASPESVYSYPVSDELDTLTSELHNMLDGLQEMPEYIEATGNTGVAVIGLGIEFSQAFVQPTISARNLFFWMGIAEALSLFFQGYADKDVHAVRVVDKDFMKSPRTTNIILDEEGRADD